MKLIMATHNANKAREIEIQLPEGYQLRTLTDIGWHDEIIEDADTLEGNALIKARAVYEQTGETAFGDDTGLLVTALSDRPGVYTARYAGPQKDSNDNMTKLLQELEDKTDRSARFVTVIALVGAQGECVFTGVCPGTITKERSGEEGFGYDPIFQPTGYDRTFAQMPMSEKAPISHRGKAVAQLLNHLQNQMNSQ